MDNQIYLMSQYQKDDNTIAYVFSEEIVLIKREYTSDGVAVLYEIILSIETGKAIARRQIGESEMKSSEFDETKKRLTDDTDEERKEEWRLTHKNVSLDYFDNTAMMCLPSVEDDYIAQNFRKKGLEKNIDTAMMILNTVLNKKQKRWFIMSQKDKLSDREIARREGVAHTTVSRGLIVAKKKIEKFLKNFSVND